MAFLYVFAFYTIINKVLSVRTTLPEAYGKLVSENARESQFTLPI